MTHSVVPNQDWHYFATHTLVVPSMVLVVIMIILSPLSIMFVAFKWYEKGFVYRYIGSKYYKPSNPNPYCAIQIIQFITSATSVGLWIICTYRRYRVFLELEAVVTPFFIFAYMIEMVKLGFSPLAALGPASLVDVFTIVPTLASWSEGVQTYDSNQWVSFLFLRVITVYSAFRDIEGSGFPLPLSTFTREVCLLALRTVTLVVVLAGTILTLEILGEVPFLHTTMIDTSMGNLGFVQMIYWIFTTISTVGYGDFTPTTVLSRLFTILFIVIGVVFFGVETTRLQELIAVQKHGMGAYAADKRRKHVVICGGGVKTSGQVLYSLLEELYSSEEEARWPNTVIMSASGFEGSLKNHIGTSLPAQVRAHLFTLVGSPMLREDRERVGIATAAAVYIIADVAAVNAYHEDGQNFLRALAIRKGHPDVHLRFMALKEETRRWAINAGLPECDCFSMEELKVRCIAHTVYCHGFLTLLSNLVDSDDVPIDEMGVQVWKNEYINGSNNTMYAISVPSKYAGLTWSEFIAMFFNDTGSMVFAGQVNGAVKLNPGLDSSSKLEGGEVAFVISYEQPEQWLEGDGNDEWIENFHEARSALTRVGEQLGVDHERHHLHKKTGLLRHTSTSISNVDDAVHRRSKLWNNGVEDTDHIVVLACSLVTSNWVHISLLLEALLISRQPDNRPILVLASVDPPPDISRRFPDIIFARRLGEVLSQSDLEMAQLHAASDVILLSDEVPETNRDAFKDQDTVLIASALDSYLKTAKRPVAILHDFLCPESANFLPEVGERDNQKIAQMHIDTDVNSVQRTWKKHLGLWRDSLRLQPRFAMGQMFTLNFVGSMLGREYFVPSTMEVVLTLVSCHEQSSIPLLIPVPEEFRMKMYGELVNAFLEDPDVAIPLGVRRQLYPESEHGQEKVLGYVITNPVRDFVLHDTDQVYVLAPPAFCDRFAALSKRDSIISMNSVSSSASAIEPPRTADDKSLFSSQGECLTEVTIEVGKSKPQELEDAIAKLQEAIAHLSNLRPRTQVNI